MTLIREDACGEVEVCPSRGFPANVIGRSHAAGRSATSHSSLHDEVRMFALIAGSIDDDGGDDNDQEEFQLQAPKNSKSGHREAVIHEESDLLVALLRICILLS